MVETAGPADSAADDSSRLEALQELTARLARASSSAEVAAIVLHEGADRQGAVTGSLCLLDDGELELSASVGYPESVTSTYRRFPMDETSPAGLCAVTGRSVYCSSFEELYERFPSFRERPNVGDPSFAVLPLVTGDSQLLGTMVFGFAKPQSFHYVQRQFLEALAREAGVALERARANEALVEARAAAEAAQELLAFLASASSRLAASLNLDDTLETIAELAVPRIADRCVLYLMGTSSELEQHPLAPSPSEDEQALLDYGPPTLEDRNGVGAVIRSGEAVFVAEVDEDLLASIADSPEHLELMRKVGIGETFIVPLQARGKRVGALAFINRRGRPFTTAEATLGEELAARTAFAIDNALLFGRELRIAETLQHALLPESLPKPNGVELAAKYLPGTRGIDVGGDWYDVMQLDAERVLFVVGDVSGHGLQAATRMASLRHAIRGYAIEGHEPDRILGLLAQLLDVGRDGNFATVLCGVLDVAKAQVTLASAGHFGPLLVDGGRTSFLDIEAGPPIGVTTPLAYRSGTFSIPARASIVAFTDGLVERRLEHLDTGLERLREVGRANHELPLDSFLDAIVQDMIPSGSDDDTAVLGLRLTS